MKNNGLFKFWNIIYPILIYYVVSNVVMYIAILALGITGTDYAAHYMMLQTIATAAALPVLYGFYRKDQLFFTVFQQRTGNEWKKLSKKTKIIQAVVVFVCGALAGLALNNIIGATGLAELSNGYQEITAHFWSGGALFEFLGAGILIPIAEEILYRGIVYGRLSDWIKIPSAAVVSALIFGGLHLNIVQFIYAFLIGLLLVFFLEKTHSLLGAILGHVGANFFTVLRIETNAFDWMESSTVVFWAATILMLAVCAALIRVLMGKGSVHGR